MSKAVLITGASSGFGWGLSKDLAAKGHHVIATMRGINGKNEDKATELRNWANENSYKVDVVEIDVTNDASVDNGVQAAIKAAGKIDVLVNNAGVGTWGIQEGFDMDQVKWVFDVNVFGPMRLNKALLPHFRENGGGYIQYVTSALGRTLLPFLGPYNGTKFALEAIAETGHYELAPEGIETTIVQPGAYGTSFLGNTVAPTDPDVLDVQPNTKAIHDGFTAQFEEAAKTGQLGDPQEVVDAMLELIEADSGTRPLRLPIGADMAEGVIAINAVSAQVQQAMGQAMGFIQE